MKNRAKYFDKHGSEIDITDACDRHGVLRNGFAMRVSTTMRDSMRARDALVGTGSHGPRGQQPGDICTIDGSAGHLRKVNGELVCVPLKSSDAKPAFTDGHNIVDPAAGLKPGWRMPTVQDRRAVRDAYAAYETSLVNRYRVGDGVQCPDCFGSGEINGEACSACNGNGIMSERSSRTSKGFGSSNEGGHNTPDPASDAQTMIRDHRANMDRLYAERDAELSNAWRTK
jgi:hypothetical protein